MKKFLLALCALLFCVGFEAEAQVYRFKATDFAYRVCDDDGYWSEWTDWEDCNLLVVVNVDREQIDIYSSEPQSFIFYEVGDETEDSDGGTQVEFRCVDADGLRCTIRRRVQSDGQLQIYIDYSDISYVYCIEER